MISKPILWVFEASRHYRALCIVVLAATTPGSLQAQRGLVTGLGGFGVPDRGVGGVLDVAFGRSPLSFVGGRALLSNDLQGNVAALGLVAALDVPLVDSYHVAVMGGIAGTSRSESGETTVRPAFWGGLGFPLLHLGSTTLLGSMFAMVDKYETIPMFGLELRFSSSKERPSPP